MFETYEEIPEDWKLEKISNLSKVSTGGTPSTSNQQYWKNGNIPWINSGEIQDNNVTNSSKYITKAGLESKHLQKLPKNTVVIGITGYVGKVGILTFETTTNQSVTGIFPSQKFISKFLFYFLISRRQYILRFSVATAQLHINQQVVKNLLIFLPPLPEQKQIATILSSVDDAIQKTNQIIDQTQRLKKGMHSKAGNENHGSGRERPNQPEWQAVPMSGLHQLLPQPQHHQQHHVQYGEF